MAMERAHEPFAAASLALGLGSAVALGYGFFNGGWTVVVGAVVAPLALLAAVIAVRRSRHRDVGDVATGAALGLATLVTLMAFWVVFIIVWLIVEGGE